MTGGLQKRLILVVCPELHPLSSLSSMVPAFFLSLLFFSSLFSSLCPYLVIGYSYSSDCVIGIV